MVLPFPSEAFNLIMFPALESCFNYQEKNLDGANIKAGTTCSLKGTRKAGVEPLPEVPTVTRPSAVPAGE